MGAVQRQTLLRSLVLLLAVKSCSCATDSRRLARNIPRLPCTSQGVEWVRSPSSCSKYVVCGFGQPMATMLCPNSMVWSVEVKNCVPKGSRWDDCSGMETSQDSVADEHSRLRDRDSEKSENSGDFINKEMVRMGDDKKRMAVFDRNRGSGDSPNWKLSGRHNRNSHKTTSGIDWRSSGNNHKTTAVLDWESSETEHITTAVLDWESSETVHKTIPVLDWENSKTEHKTIPVLDWENSKTVHKTIPVLDWRNVQTNTQVSEWDNNQNDQTSTKVLDWKQNRNDDKILAVPGWKFKERGTIVGDWRSEGSNVESDWRNQRNGEGSNVESDWRNQRYVEGSRVESGWRSERNGEGSSAASDWRNQRNGEGSRVESDWRNQRNGEGSRVESDWRNERNGEGSSVESGWRNERNGEGSSVRSDWRNERNGEGSSVRSERRNREDSSITSEWRNGEDIRVRSDWRNERNDNRRKAGKDWTGNHYNSRRRSDKTGVRDRNYDERSSQNPVRWRNKKHDTSWGYTHIPSETNSRLTSASTTTAMTTPSLLRWRWSPWDRKKADYDQYPSYRYDDDAFDSPGYPPKAKENYPTFSEKYPTYTHSYITDRHVYPGESYPSLANYEDYPATAQDYPTASAQWLRTTPARVLKHTTTFKSPFARFDTTRRRLVIVDDGKNYQGNQAWPKYRTIANAKENDSGKGGNEWRKKTPWWHTWDPRSSKTDSTTSRPWWWAPVTVLPWLTPSSIWTAQAVITTSPLVSSSYLPQTTSFPPTSTPSTAATSQPSTSTASTKKADSESSIAESGVSPTDYYDNDEDSGNHNDFQWWKTTKGSVKKVTHAPRPKTTPPEYRAPWQPENDTQIYQPECGVAVTNMIVGGLPASEGRWPWVVSLRLTWARRHVCGGTLVHPQWIVTAAHCVFGSQFEEANDWRAVFGNIQPTLTSDVKEGLKIDLIVRHPEFVNGGNYPNDIAMMRLEKPVDVSGFRIRHACLPSRHKPFLSSSECWIMGWGETKGFEEQSVLQELVVKIRRNQACAARWGWKRILNSHVCVGNGDGGACNGDSGGPLVCLRDGYYYLAGVTSWGVSGCQTTGYPSVFSRVSFYDKWIESVIQTYSTIHFPLKK